MGALLFELEEAIDFPVRVSEPRRQRESDVGPAVDGVQLGKMPAPA
jgi:hypothetical protein